MTVSFLVPLAMGVVCVAMAVASSSLGAVVFCIVGAVLCFAMAVYDFLWPVM